ncbi:MAG: hypothetical protein JSW47_00545 [Phycisphaerales bacterium]|nr:MAG: hypothetical protein JSW47_00545 [Phycisphaerales bacterium]
MPLHVRSIAVSIAVICFFVMSLIGWASGLTPFVCCKRALIGAVLAYMAGCWAVRAINSILVNAILASQTKKQDSADFTTTSNMDLGDTDSGAAG